MTRNNSNKDWTDAVRDTLQGVGMTPSEGFAERLEASLEEAGALRAKKLRRNWFIAIGSAAAAALVLGLVLPRSEPSMPSGNLVAQVQDVPGELIPEKQVQDVPGELIPEEKVQDYGAGDRNGIDTGASDTPAVRESGEAISVNAGAAGELNPEMAATESPNIEPVASETLNTETPNTETPNTEPEAAEVPKPENDATGELNPEPDAAGVSTGRHAGSAGAKPSRAKVRTVREPRKLRMAIGFSAGSSLVASAPKVKLPSGSGSGMQKSAARYDIGDVLEHSAPSCRSLELFIPLSRKLHLETGLSFTEYDSRFKTIREELEFTGIPLRLGYIFADWKRLTLSINAGTVYEQCGKAVLMDKSYEEKAQWSASAGLLARLRIAGPFNLYASPCLTYYITQTTLPSLRSIQPLSLQFSAGISVDF